MSIPTQESGRPTTDEWEDDCSESSFGDKSTDSWSPEWPGQRRPNPNADVTGSNVEPPKNLSVLTCKCKADCRRKRKGVKAFCCRSWGKSCSADCNCNDTCENIWSKENKDRMFGSSEKECFPHGCFVHWYEKNTNPSAVDMEYLLKLALPFGEISEYHSDIEAFEKQWSTVAAKPQNDPERLKLAQRLVRFAFTDDRHNLLGDGYAYSEYWYSFCRARGSWQDGNTTHCWACRGCMEWRDWHCNKCNECTYGVSIPCEGCGGMRGNYHG